MVTIKKKKKNDALRRVFNVSTLVFPRVQAKRTFRSSLILHYRFHPSRSLPHNTRVYATYTHTQHCIANTHTHTHRQARANEIGPDGSLAPRTIVR